MSEQSTTVSEPTLDGAKKACEVFKNEFSKPRCDEHQLQIARYTILFLLKRIEVLEEQLKKTHYMAQEAYRQTARF